MQKTLAFLREVNVIHSVCDEPQAGQGSIPLVPVSTRSDKVLFRLYGLMFTVGETRQETTRCGVKYVIIKSKSGKHAVQNAKQFQRKLNPTYDNLAPKQLGLFEGEW